MPSFSGSYGADPDGVPYQVFSPDLARGLLLNGRPLPSRGRTLPGRQPTPRRDRRARRLPELLPAPGRRLRGPDRRIRRFQPGLDPAHFTVRLAGASRDLDHVVLATCAALTTGATEVPLGGGCDPAKQNLYEWSAGSGLSLVNSAPGAALAAQAGAISADGSRVYFTNSTTATSTCETPVSSSRSTATPPEGGPSRPPAATGRSRTSSRAATSGATRPAPTRPPTSPPPAGSSECSAPPPTAPTPTTSPPTASMSGTGAARRKRQPRPTRPTIRPPPGRPGSATTAPGWSSSPRPPSPATTTPTRKPACPIARSSSTTPPPESSPASPAGPTAPVRSAPRRSPGPAPTASCRGHRGLQAEGALGRRQPGLLRLRRLPRPGRRQP